MKMALWIIGAALLAAALFVWCQHRRKDAAMEASWLARHGRPDEAEKALERIRGPRSGA